MPRYYGNQNAGVGLSLFSPTFRAKTPFMDTTLAQNTYDTLEKGHQQAIAQAAAYKKAIADMDLNEAEDGWRQQLMDEIDYTLASNTQYGNSYAALDDIIKKYGDIEGNMGLVGRLRAQQQYKTYLDELSKSNLTEEQKNYYKEVNPYYYQDKVDNNGRVVGGTAWKPNEQFVDNVPLDEAYIEALKLAAEDAGGGDTIYYKDKNGQYTTDASLSVDHLPYYQIHSNYQRLSEDKIRQAMKSVIATKPGLAASIAQDYKIDLWQYNKQGGKGESIVTDAKGVPLTQDQYLDKKLRGFYNSSTYNRVTTSRKDLAGMEVDIYQRKQQALNAAKRNASGGGFGGELVDTIRNIENTTKGIDYIEKDSTLKGSVARNVASKDIIRNFCQERNIAFNANDVEKSYNALLQAYSDDEIIPKDLYDAYNDYVYSKNMISQIIPAEYGEYRDKTLFLSALESGLDISLTNKKYVDEYVNLGKQFIGKDGVRKLIVQEDPKLQDYGIDIPTRIDDNGNKYIELTNADISRLYQIAQIVGNKANSAVSYGSGFLTPPVNPFYKINTFYNQLEKDVSKVVDNAPNTVTPTTLVSAEDVVSSWANDQVADGQFSDTEKARKAITDRISAGLHSAQGQKYDMYFSNSGNAAQYVDNDVVKHYLLEVAKSRYDDKKATISYDKNNPNNTVIHVQLSNKDTDYDKIKDYLKQAGLKNVNDFDILVKGLFGSELKTEILNSPILKNSIEFSSYNNSGVTRFDNFDGTSTTKVDDNNWVVGNEYEQRAVDYEGAVKSYAANKLYSDIVYEFYSAKKRNGNMVPQGLEEWLTNNVAKLVNYMGYDINSISGRNKIYEIKQQVYNYNLR